jgi:hypothetical protein
LQCGSSQLSAAEVLEHEARDDTQRIDAFQARNVDSVRVTIVWRILNVKTVDIMVYITWALRVHSAIMRVRL